MMLVGLLGFVFVRCFFTFYHGIHHHFSPPFGNIFGIFSNRLDQKSKFAGNVVSWLVVYITPI